MSKFKTQIVIEGSRWFDKQWGNTYCSSRIYINGDHVATLPMTYGYGNYFEQMSLEYLKKKGLIEVTGILQLEADYGIKVLSIAKDGLKRELDKKAWERD